jgi:hypothetical protein
MAAASHLPSTGFGTDYNGMKVFGFVVIVAALLELNAIKGKTDNLKITSIAGVTHMGIVLTAILYFGIELLAR